ncbi:MAG: DNA cytosine methyltransferase [Pontiellaceae bacterium]|nr:DNA cytosine methyltransferase [Pontiellaceae bacterium]MBN2785185.1 DNA cytosine methyltransferase [Pontiellaceae bacterium]
MKILNLYAGIGGNRKLWGNKHEIVAVESDPEVAGIYKELFPSDTVIVGDAHEYLRLHFKEFDFIWSSPPCQTHSGIRQNIGVRCRGYEPKYPDMTLYEEIIFLMHNARCLWVVENVRPYYKPLIAGQAVHRHLFWSNMEIPAIKTERANMHGAPISELQRRYGFDLSGHRLPNKRQTLRNCVNPELGKHILDIVISINSKSIADSIPTNPTPKP